MTELWQLAILVGWLASLLLAAYLGYDRGRWLTGLILGLLLGPLGVIGAGFLTPSFRWELDRKYRLARQLRRVQQRAAERIRAQHREAAEFDRLAESLGEQLKNDRELFSEQLGHLAQELEQILDTRSARKPELRTWVSWLRQQRDIVRERERVPANNVNALE